MYPILEIPVLLFVVVPWIALRARQRGVNRIPYVVALIVGFALFGALGLFGLPVIALALRWIWVGGLYLVVEFLANRGRTASGTWQCPDCRMFNDFRTLECLCGALYERPLEQDGDSQSMDAGDQVQAQADPAQRCVASEPERSTRMPKRVLVLWSVGPPFGGMRLAVNPSLFGCGNAPVFAALERAVHNIQSVLAAYPPATWSRLAQSEAAVGDAADFLEGRACFFDTLCDSTSTTGGVVIRAFLPFRLWPYGGWTVYDAWHREADGRWIAFSEEEINEIW